MKAAQTEVNSCLMMSLVNKVNQFQCLCEGVTMSLGWWLSPWC